MWITASRAIQACGRCPGNGPNMKEWKYVFVGKILKLCLSIIVPLTQSALDFEKTHCKTALPLGSNLDLFLLLGFQP
jgi:hypothetical protein